MPNTNFQTFHQMGQAINEVVRQATGRDVVQNIDMDHVTVAQNSYYEEITASGSMVSFTDKVGGMPLEKCIVQIEPVQDLHGYSKPWAGGAGKNLAKLSDDIVGNNQKSTVAYSDSGATITATGTYGRYGWLIPVTRGQTYIISFLGKASSETGMNSKAFFGSADGTWSTSDTGYLGFVGIPTTAGMRSFSFTASSNVLFFGIYVTSTSTSGNIEISNVQLELGSTATDYTPYSNICPITGWTGANIHVSPTTDAQDGTTYSITFPAEAGTVYGGTLTVNADGSGTLVVDRVSAQIPSADILYASSALAGRYFTRQNYFSNLKNGSELLCNAFLGLSTADSRDMGVVYISAGQVIFNTPFDTLENFKSWINANPISIVYELATPQTYTLTTDQIKTIQGQNNIWADTGDIEVKYKVLKELY